MGGCAGFWVLFLVLCALTCIWVAALFMTGNHKAAATYGSADCCAGGSVTCAQVFEPSCRRGLVSRVPW